jgi:hypothetical protein
MNSYGRRVERKCLDLNLRNLLYLQLLEQRVQYTLLCPSVHRHVDRMPAAKAPRTSTPFATLLGHIQNCVQDLQVAYAHVATLHRQTVVDASVLLVGDLHYPNILGNKYLIV